MKLLLLALRSDKPAGITKAVPSITSAFHNLHLKYGGLINLLQSSYLLPRTVLPGFYSTVQDKDALTTEFTVSY
jgi:hypothetical protein